MRKMLLRLHEELRGVSIDGDAAEGTSLRNRCAGIRRPGAGHDLPAPFACVRTDARGPGSANPQRSVHDVVKRRVWRIREMASDSPQRVALRPVVALSRHASVEFFGAQHRVQGSGGMPDIRRTPILTRSGYESGGRCGSGCNSAKAGSSAKLHGPGMPLVSAR